MEHRAVSEIAVQNWYLIPVVDELLDEMYRCSIFNKLDLKSGYNWIEMMEEDIDKTTFQMHEGHYEFKVMPFRLTNALVTF